MKRSSTRNPTRRGARAAVETTTTIKRGRREVYKECEKSVIETDEIVKPGIAKIDITHGKKYWCSTQVDGLSVESTCTISLNCAQKQTELDRANDQASKLAWSYMRRNFDKVKKDLNEFMETEP